MTWEIFYLSCFGIGLGLSVLSFAGGLHHQFHFGHGTGHGGGFHARGGSDLSPVNGFTLTAFLCWFGGTGYLLVRYGGFLVPLVLMLSTLSGLCGGLLIFLVSGEGHVAAREAVDGRRNRNVRRDWPSERNNSGRRHGRDLIFTERSPTFEPCPERYRGGHSAQH